VLITVGTVLESGVAVNNCMGLYGVVWSCMELAGTIVAHHSP